MNTTRSKFRPQSLLSRALATATLSLSSLTAFAYIDIPNSAPIVDLTGTLSDQQVKTLTSEIQDLDARSGAEIEMLMLPSTDGEPIKSYSWRVAEAWRPGHSGVNRGLVVVIAKNDHHSYIQVGRGLESVVNNDVATSLAKNMSPFFRQGDFYGGLTQDLNDLASLIVMPQAADPANTTQAAPQDTGAVNNAPLPQQPPEAQMTAAPAVAAIAPTQQQAAAHSLDLSAWEVALVAAVLLGLMYLFYAYFVFPKRSKNRQQAASLYPKSSSTSSGFTSSSRTSSSSATSTTSKPASTVRPAATSAPAASSVTPAAPRTSNDALFGSDFTRNPRTSAPDPRRTSAPDARRASSPDPRRSSSSSTNLRSSSSSSSARRTSSYGSRSNSDDGFAAGYVAGSLSNSSSSSDYYRRSDDTPSVSTWADTSPTDSGGAFGGTGGGGSWDNS